MTAAAQTAWAAGSLSGAQSGGRLLFGRMYEDSAIERAAFRGRPRVFCIASAGCTALGLAAGHDVVACDINPVQLAYAQRRVHGAPRETGSAEKLMNFARHAAPLAGWRQRSTEEFLHLTRPSEQLAYWRRHLDTRRLQAGLDLLLSRPLLRLAYANPLVQVLPPDFGQVLRQRLARGFARHANAVNPFAWALLKGEVPFDEPCGKADRQATFVHADAATYLASQPPHSFDAFAFSNILDGATPAYAGRLWQAAHRAARPGAVAVIRSFAEPHRPTEPNLAEEDRSLLWGTVEVRSLTPALSY